MAGVLSGPRQGPPGEGLPGAGGGVWGGPSSIVLRSPQGAVVVGSVSSRDSATPTTHHDHDEDGQDTPGTSILYDGK